MSFWRKDLPVLNRHNQVTKGGMWEHQLQWWESTNFIKALITGYGGGKTFIGSKRALAMSLHNAPSPFFIVSPTYKMAKRTVIPTLLGLCRGKATLTNLQFKYNKSDFELKIWYKGREAIIWIGSGDDPESLKGPNVCGGWIDEPFIQKEEVFIQTIARIRDPIAKHKELNLTGTPETLNWGYEICEGERAGNYDLGIVHASTRANLALDTEYAKTLEKALTDEMAQSYIEGAFVNLQTGIVYYGFNKNRNVKELPDPNGELFVGMDFNVDPMAAVVFWKNGNHLHFINEIELRNADTEYMCSYLIEKYKYQNGDLKGRCRIHEIFPDSSGNSRSTKSPGGKTDFHYIEKAGFKINAPHANPLIRDRENSVNGKLNPKEGLPTITMDPKCKKLIGYFLRYNHAEKHKQKAMSHLIDAIGYSVHRLFPIIHNSPIVTRLHGL